MDELDRIRIRLLKCLMWRVNLVRTEIEKGILICGCGISDIYSSLSLASSCVKQVEEMLGLSVILTIGNENEDNHLTLPLDFLSLIPEISDFCFKDRINIYRQKYQSVKKILATKSRCNHFPKNYQTKPKRC